MTAREFDHGELNVPFARRFPGGLDAEIDRNLKRIAAEDAATAKAAADERKAARSAEAQRVKLTAADLARAIAVRDRFGWHRVVRVSAKSVTVATPHSWTERIPLDRVLEHRTA